MAADVAWSPVKDAELRQRYGIGFDDIMAAINAGGLLDERRHPNAERYPHQRQLIVAVRGYVWVVPFVHEGPSMFLKTMFPSRKAMRDYRRNRDGEK